MNSIKERWMNAWGGFEKKHPKLAKWVYQIFYFFVFSMGVTIFQYLVFTIMPHILGKGLAGTEFMWPQVDLELFGVPFTWSLLGYNVVRDASGAVMIGGGLGYFISYEVGSFLAQCINFPLQRNITFPAPEKYYVQEQRQSGLSGNVVFYRMGCDLADLQRIQQPVDADRSGICGAGDLQSSCNIYYRRCLHGYLFLCIQDHFPGRRAG